MVYFSANKCMQQRYNTLISNICLKVKGGKPKKPAWDDGQPKALRLGLKMARSLDLPTGTWFIPRLDKSSIAAVLFERRNPSIISKSLAAHSLSKETKEVPERRLILGLETQGDQSLY